MQIGVQNIDFTDRTDQKAVTPINVFNGTIGGRTKARTQSQVQMTDIGD